VLFQQCGLLLPQVQADCIRTAIKVSNDVALPSNPFRIVRSAAIQRAIKERLPKATHINYHSKLALESPITEGCAYAPRNVTIETRKNQRLFLQRQFRKIVVDGQQHNPLLNAANA
jgi:ribosomal protein S18